ncbi:uncharacterized protein BP5553_00597 [Venustampulla echinocandica]|uniref:Uncharacterized protein n=1 Tax=Venustampulla echinocandica TaxID=2656787 RepID=A0A370TYM1_9HELO|nr:uncharacterized protein BP5553_00597 [Venustampulla echinocandica]RDL40618.1 hypothetical protein BP5553_00597 [Venustampulla echinocandica]
MPYTAGLVHGYEVSSPPDTTALPAPSSENLQRTGDPLARKLGNGRAALCAQCNQHHQYSAHGGVWGPSNGLHQGAMHGPGDKSAHPEIQPLGIERGTTRPASEKANPWDTQILITLFNVGRLAARRKKWGASKNAKPSRTIDPLRLAISADSPSLSPTATVENSSRHTPLADPSVFLSPSIVLIQVGGHGGTAVEMEAMEATM